MTTTSLFIDGADPESLALAKSNTLVKGITTNPTIIAKAGITDYLSFARELVEKVRNKSVSLEVFSDDFIEMKRQALILGSLGDNVFVKIPITNTKGDSSVDLINELLSLGVQLNITAILDSNQLKEILHVLNPSVSTYISVFAGRIADTGRDPVPIMREVLSLLSSMPLSQLIWASPREVLNYYQAQEIGCGIITMTKDLILKLGLYNKNLREYSLETVTMFREDAIKAGFSL
jgi:transaldolase